MPVVRTFDPATGASGGGGEGGGGGDFRLVPDDAGNVTTATNGVEKTVGFNVSSGTSTGTPTAALLDKPPGSSLVSGNLTVDNTDAANPDVVFTPDALGRFIIGLTVSDADSNESQAVTIVQVSPDPPRLSAPSATSGGVDGNVVNVTFTNDGGAVASTSATLVKPAGSSATLSHSSPSLSASYTPDVPGNYAVEMDGTNGDGTSPAVQARRAVESRTPTADAGSNQNDVAAGTVNLDGSGSAVHANSGGSLTYLWEFISTDTATLSSATAQSPTFTGALDESYTLRLTVTDSESGETAQDIVTVVMQATPMPAARGICDITTDTQDDTSFTANTTTTIYEDDGTTAKLDVYYNAGGNSAGGDTVEVTEANGCYITGEYSGSGASLNRRMVIKPQYPDATLNYNGRIVVAGLFKVFLGGASSGSPATVRIVCGAADDISDYNSPGSIGIKIREEAAVAWSAISYPTSTESASAAATGNFTTDPAGGYILVVWAWDEAAPIKVKLGQSTIPDNINDISWDFECAARTAISPTAGSSNPFANGIAVAIYLNDDNNGVKTGVSCERLDTWTDAA